MSDDDLRAARAQAAERRPEALALARVLRANDKVRPAVRYECPAGRSDGRGRGGCLMLAVYSTPHGPLWFRPALRQTPLLAAERGIPLPAEDVAELLGDTVASSGGAMLSGLAVCRHFVASLTVGQMESDYARRAGTVVLEHDTPGAVFYRGPRTVL